MATVSNMTIRTWAKEQDGLKVGVRGRLPKPVIKEFLAHHPTAARALAAEKGITVTSKKGKVSNAVLNQIVGL